MRSGDGDLRSKASTLERPTSSSSSSTFSISSGLHIICLLCACAAQQKLFTYMKRSLILLIASHQPWAYNIVYVELELEFTSSWSLLPTTWNAVDSLCICGRVQTTDIANRYAFSTMEYRNPNKYTLNVFIFIIT